MNGWGGSRDVVCCAFCPSRYPFAIMKPFGNGLICPGCQRELVDAAERTSSRYQPALRAINKQDDLPKKQAWRGLCAPNPLMRHRPEPVAPDKRKRINWAIIGFWGLYGGVALALCFWWGRWLLK